MKIINTMDKIIIRYNNDHKEDNYNKKLNQLLFHNRDILHYLFTENETINGCAKISEHVSLDKDHKSIVKGILHFFDKIECICNVKEKYLYTLLDKYGCIWIDLDTKEIITDENKICLLNMIA